MQIQPVWFDLLGAKSMCVLVRTPDISLLIDPGAAIMQPRYPAPDALKDYYLGLAIHAIGNALKEATHLIITHYHYDHFRPELLSLYQGKTLWIKDPNRWINRSQWKRARMFLAALAEDEGLQLKQRPPDKEDYLDPVEELSLAAKVKRREDLLHKWRKRFLSLRSMWRKGLWCHHRGRDDGKGSSHRPACSLEGGRDPRGRARPGKEQKAGLRPARCASPLHLAAAK